MLQIPLSSGSQRFSIGLGNTYCDVAVIWRDAGDCPGWFLDIEAADGSASARGIALVPGVDLLAQLQHKGLGHLYCTVDGRTVSEPAYEDMGSKVALYWEA